MEENKGVENNNNENNVINNNIDDNTIIDINNDNTTESTTNNSVIENNVPTGYVANNTIIENNVPEISSENNTIIENNTPEESIADNTIMENGVVLESNDNNPVIDSSNIENPVVENNNAPKKENKNFFNIIGIILVLIIFGVSGFIIYKDVIGIDKNINQNPNNNSSNHELSESEINKLGFEKYNMLYSKNSYLNNTFIFFKDESVTNSTLTNQEKLSLLYSFLTDDDKNKTGTYAEDCFLSKGIYTAETYPESCPKETFDTALLDEKKNTYFGNDFKVDYTNFYASSSYQCFIKGSTYTCLLNASDYKIMEYTTFMKYDYAKLENNVLEIYNYLLTARKYPISNYEKGIYSNSSATNKIDDLPFEIGNAINDELIDKLVNQYKDQITRYKTTFTKVNNNYLWQSTEIIK